jgi:hypothetical protein
MIPHAEREVYYSNRSPIVGITLRVMIPHAEREVYYPNRSPIVGITLRVMIPHAEREVYNPNRSVSPRPPVLRVERGWGRHLH